MGGAAAGGKLTNVGGAASIGASKEYLLPNDIEMMLYAYSLSQGRPWRNLQSYKTNPKLGTVFSDVIKNRNDYYVEEKK